MGDFLAPDGFGAGLAALKIHGKPDVRARWGRALPNLELLDAFNAVLAAYLETWTA
jgi:hypothetical protein